MAYMYYKNYATQSKYINETKRKTQKKCQQNTATKVKRVYHFVN